MPGKQLAEMQINTLHTRQPFRGMILARVLFPRTVLNRYETLSDGVYHFLRGNRANLSCFNGYHI